jgi:two-component system chemotaxis response regulator CheY
MQILREGEVRFVIVDRVTTDMEEKKFIKNLRDAQPPHYIYILLIASKKDTDITTPRGGADDYLHKPVVPAELKSRVFIGERMLGLGDNLVQARETLEKSAMYDALTQTLNENAFLRLSHGEIERARRGMAPLSLIAFEIDNLEAIAEKHGNDVANDVLILVAQAIREKSRPYDGVGRFGGNTFLIPLPSVIGHDAEKIAQRIIRGIMNANVALLDGTAVNLDISAGIVSSLRVSVSTDMGKMIEKVKEATAISREHGSGRIYTFFL